MLQFVGLLNPEAYPKVAAYLDKLKTHESFKLAYKALL